MTHAEIITLAGWIGQAMAAGFASVVFARVLSRRGGGGSK